MVPVESGAIGPIERRMPPESPPSSSVSNVTSCGRPDWLETMMTTGPAPNEGGVTRTRWESIGTVTLIGAGGRSAFSRSSSAPPALAPAARATAAITTRACTAANVTDATARSRRPDRGVRHAGHARRSPARLPARGGGVPGGRHRDQRPAEGPLRADRGRGGAGGRRRAARPLELGGRRRAAARARHPALHRDHPGDGRRGAAPRGGPPGAGGPAARPRAGGALGAVRRRGAPAGVRPRRAHLAGSAGGVHGGARPAVRAAAAPARPRRAGGRARHRRGGHAPRAARRRDVRPRAVRAPTAAVRERPHDPRGARAAVPAEGRAPAGAPGPPPPRAPPPPP